MVHAVEQNSLFVVGMAVHCFECNMTVGHLKNLETFLDIGVGTFITLVPDIKLFYISMTPV